MIEKITEATYDWYVLNLREFYKEWIENLGVRIREVTDMPLWVYKEQGFKETFLDCWKFHNIKADEMYMNSLRRYCDRGMEKIRLETNLSSH